MGSHNPHTAEAAVRFNMRTSNTAVTRYLDYRILRYVSTVGFLFTRLLCFSLGQRSAFKALSLEFFASAR